MLGKNELLLRRFTNHVGNVEWAVIVENHIGILPIVRKGQFSRVFLPLRDLFNHLLNLLFLGGGLLMDSVQHLAQTIDFRIILFDCAMRKAAYDFGRKLIPRQGGFASLFYALDLNDPDCQGKFAEPLVEAKAPKPDPIPPDAVFVSPSGMRGASGKPDAPLRSIQEAADLAVASGRRTVVLRGGTHYLSAPIALGAHHSGLRFVAHPGESPVISGGVEIQTAWQPYKVQPGGSNIWVTAVGDEVDEVPGLQIGGVRATRARYPNLPGGIEVVKRYCPGSRSILGTFRGAIPRCCRTLAPQFCVSDTAC